MTIIKFLLLVFMTCLIINYYDSCIEFFDNISYVGSKSPSQLLNNKNVNYTSSIQNNHVKNMTIDKNDNLIKILDSIKKYSNINKQIIAWDDLDTNKLKKKDREEIESIILMLGDKMQKYKIYINDVINIHEYYNDQKAKLCFDMLIDSDYQRIVEVEILFEKKDNEVLSYINKMKII